MEVDEIGVALNQDIADIIPHCIFSNLSTKNLPVAFRQICGGKEWANTWHFESRIEEDL